MKIEEFLALLDGVTSTGDGKWVARCPAHPDGNPSLGVAVGNDGRTLVNCYAGCSAQDVVAALGLKMSDLMPDDGKLEKRGKRSAKKAAKPLAEYRASKKRPSKHVCYYDYQDASGAVVFRVDRRVYTDAKGGKTFVQLHPDPESKTGWTWGVTRAGVERVPFRLPRILEAGKSGKSVVIVEGEKDVLTLEKRLGCAATCNSGGAGKWDAGWGKHFVGVRDVLIIADKDADEKKDAKGKVKLHAVGQRHACDIERKLRADGFAGKIRKICVPDVGETHCKDFTDWVEAVEKAGGKVDKSSFLDMVKAFGEWPKKWDFGEDDLVDLQRAGKAARNTASSSTASSVDEVGEADAGTGRFGRPAPRTPGSDAKEFEVDFDCGRWVPIRLKFTYGQSIQDMITDSWTAVIKAYGREEPPKNIYPKTRAWCAAIWLVMRGSFFWNLNRREFSSCMYLDRDPKSTRLMLVESDEFYVFIAHAAKLEDVDPKKGDLGKIMGLVKQIAMSDDYSTGVVPSNLWDRRGDTVYISSGDTEMYRCCSGNVEKVMNGTDGVVFLRGKTFEPWTFSADGALDPFSNALIFKNASWADDRGQMIVRCWVLNIFANHAMKPPLLITGGAGSGKTKMASLVKFMLGARADGGPDKAVQQMEDGEKGLDAFWATVNEGRLEIFDNLDTKIKWASDTLQIAATDGTTKRRTLYTTFGVSTLRANAFLIFTSNNPIIATEGNGGMADRLITVRLVRNRHESMDSKLQEDIVEHRDQYMSWIAMTVAKALADREPVEHTINTRHPDFGEFSIRLGRAFGDEAGVVRALGGVEVDKLLLPIQNDAVAAEIWAALEAREFKWRWTSQEMADDIIARLGDEADEKAKSIYSARRIGKKLASLSRQFGELLKWTGARLIQGKSVYESFGLSPFAGGLVGLKGQFGEILERESESGLSAISPTNPPSPPVRAGADAHPSATVQKEDNEMDGESDTDDSWEMDL